MKNKILPFLLIILIFSCGEPEPRKPIDRKTSTFLKESINRNKAFNKLEQEEFKRLIKADSLNTYEASTHGFWYYYKVQDTTKTVTPKKGDEVVYEYKIDDIYNDTIYTVKDLGERTYLVDKEELITGLQEGIKLMKEGETMVFLFPSHLAYGYAGYKKIKGNQPLKYTVTLKKITSNQ